MKRKQKGGLCPPHAGSGEQPAGRRRTGPSAAGSARTESGPGFGREAPGAPAQSPGEEPAEQRREQLLLAQLPSIVWTTDRDLNITSSTGAGLASVGVAQDRIPGRRVGSHMPGEPQRSIIVAAHQQALAGEQVTYEVSWDQNALQCFVEPLRDASGQISGCIGVALDISSRVHAERALEESEQRFRLLAERSSDMVSRHTPEGIYVYASPACRSLLGYEPEELVGHSAYELFHPDDVEVIGRSHAQAVSTALTSTVEYRVRRKDGSYAWFETTSHSILDPRTDAVVEIQASSRDVTARKLAEQALQRAHEDLERRVAERTSELAAANLWLTREVNERKAAEAKVRSVLESMTDVYIALDRTWRVTDVNPAMCTHFGVAREAIVGRNWWEAYPQGAGSMFQQHYQKALDTQTPVHFEAASRILPRWVDVHVYPTAEGVAIFLRDITDQRLAESEREARRRRQSLLIDVSEKVLAESTFEGVLARVVDAARALTEAPCGSAAYGFRTLAAPVGAQSHEPEHAPCPLGLSAVEKSRNLVAELDDVTCSHLAAETLAGILGEAGRRPIGRAVAAHLVARLAGPDGEPNGFIALGHKDPDGFTTEDEALITQLAAMTSLALRHIEARDEAAHRAAVLGAVFDAMAEPAFVYDRDGFLERVNPAAVSTVGRDPTGWDREQLSEYLDFHLDSGASLPVDDMPISRALGGETVRTQHFLISPPGVEARAVLASAAPLVVHGRFSGAVALWHDVTALKLAEDGLRSALETAQRRREEVSALLQASRTVLGRHDFATTSGAILASCKGLIGAATGFVALLEETDTDRHLRLLDPTRPDHQAATPPRMMPLKGLAEQVTRTGEPGWDNELDSRPPDTSLPPGHPRVENVLIAPLVIEQQVAGLIALGNKPGGFDQHDAHLAAAFAELVAVALSNSRARQSREASQQRLRASLREKEVLLQEIHHRVKNNLQIIASMLSLQAGHLGSEPDHGPFQESQNRIRTLALIHEKLYRTSDLEHVSFRDYVHDLASSLLLAYGGVAPRVRLIEQVEEIFLDLDTAVPLALVINELVSNCMKHAFVGREEGEITIGLRLTDEPRYLLTVADDGVGFPDDVDHLDTESLGLQMVTVLAKQLGGEVRLDRDRGTRFALSFVPTPPRRGRHVALADSEEDGR